MKLNLGSGFQSYDGFVNVDYDKNCNPDFLVDLEKQKWPFEDNSIDAVRAFYVMEHIGPGFFHFMQELYRVCKPTTEIDILTTHHRHEHFFNDPSKVRAITPEGLKLFDQTFNEYCISIKDNTSKLGLMYNVNFEMVDYHYINDNFYDNYIQEATNDKNKQKLFEQAMREKNNVIIETRIRLLVKK